MSLIDKRSRIIEIHTELNKLEEEKAIKEELDHALHRIEAKLLDSEVSEESRTRLLALKAELETTKAEAEVVSIKE